MTFTLQQLRSMPTISATQTADLKYEDAKNRVWLARTTVADGEPYDNKVTVEWFINGAWRISHEYQAV